MHLIASYMTLLGVLLLGLGAAMDLLKGGWEGKAVAFLGLLAVLTPTFLGK